MERNEEKSNNFCRDFLRGSCGRENCRFIHEKPSKTYLKELFRFCHDFQNKGCYRSNCKFIHCTVEEEDNFYATGTLPRDPRMMPICQMNVHNMNHDTNILHATEHDNHNKHAQFFRQHNNRDDDAPPEAKFRRFNYEDNGIDQYISATPNCTECEVLNHKVKLLHDNISILLKKIADLTEKNSQLTSMNEFLLEQTANARSEQSCVITSRHCTSAPVSLATVSVTPVVSLAATLPTLVPTGATPNIALGPSASRAQIITPASQILNGSTTQQLVGNSGTLIVTSAGAQQLMQVSDSGTLMGAGQTVVAVTPAQLTIGPTQQLMSSNQQSVQQLVQQSAQQLVQPQLAPQHQNQQFAAASQSVQHLAAQQSAQHLAVQHSQQLAAAQQSAQHLAVAQQSAQHLAAAQQSAQHLAAAQQSAQQHLAAAQQSAQQHLAAAAQQSAQQQLAAQQSAQQLVHQSSTQQITISSSSQPLAMPNSQSQPISFPIISQSLMPH